MRHFVEISYSERKNIFLNSGFKKEPSTISKFYAIRQKTKSSIMFHFIAQNSQKHLLSRVINVLISNLNCE